MRFFGRDEGGVVGELVKLATGKSHSAKKKEVDLKGRKRE